MNPFSGIKNNWKKAEAAVIVQNLLELFASSVSTSRDPMMHANEIVEDCWNKYSDAFSGKFGQRPHKLTVAFTSVMLRLSNIEEGSQESELLKKAAKEMRNEVLRNGSLYKMNSLDQKFLQVAVELYAEDFDDFWSN